MLDEGVNQGLYDIGDPLEWYVMQLPCFSVMLF